MRNSTLPVSIGKNHKKYDFFFSFSFNMMNFLWTSLVFFIFHNLKLSSTLLTGFFLSVVSDILHPAFFAVQGLSSKGDA